MLYHCNPINLEYKYQFLRLFGKRHVTRESADPSVVLFKNEYYLFPSMLAGFFVSNNLVAWSYYPYKNLPAHDYAPDVEVVGDYIYFCASNRDKNGMIYRCKDPRKEPFEEVSATFKFFDPKLFADDDGKVYFYWGCSDKTPIMGVELDPNNMTQKGKIKHLISGNTDICGYERMGEDHTNPKNRIPYVEGVWMTKHGGKYYLQYACNGTEYNVYADGVYESDSPLGPFVLAKNNPYSYKPGGFINGAGHGSTFEDKFGNFWHIATLAICKGFMFERRLGLFPSGFDCDGELFCNQRYGDWVIPILQEKFDPWTEPKWMLLSYKKKISASSYCKKHRPDFVSDENIGTWWKAASNQLGEWIMMDLGEEMNVNAIQINFADDKLKLKKPKDAQLGGGEKHFGIVLLRRYIDTRKHATRWKLEASKNGKDFITVEDKSKANTDLSHDLVICENGLSARYLKLTVLEVPLNQPATISGLRVFGKCNQKTPKHVENVCAERINDLDMKIKWDTVPDATGYNILWGHDKNKLYHSYMVFEKTEKVISALVKAQKYYLRVDAFNEGGITHGNIIEVV